MAPQCPAVKSHREQFGERQMFHLPNSFLTGKSDFVNLQRIYYYISVANIMDSVIQVNNQEEL